MPTTRNGPAIKVSLGALRLIVRSHGLEHNSLSP